MNCWISSGWLFMVSRCLFWFDFSHVYVLGFLDRLLPVQGFQVFGGSGVPELASRLVPSLGAKM